jgi:hypothetical protein
MKLKAYERSASVRSQPAKQAQMHKRSAPVKGRWQDHPHPKSAEKLRYGIGKQLTRITHLCILAALPLQPSTIQDRKQHVNSALQARCVLPRCAFNSFYAANAQTAILKTFALPMTCTGLT